MQLGGCSCTCPADGKAAAKHCQALMLHPHIGLQSSLLPHNCRIVELGSFDIDSLQQHLGVVSRPSSLGESCCYKCLGLVYMKAADVDVER